MKKMFALMLIVAALTVSAQTNSVHNWTLKSGAVFPGDYFTSGAQMVVIKSHGTNCLLKISELSTNDWLYFQDCKAAQRQRQLDAEVAQMQTAGIVEVSANLIRDFPEKVSGIANDRHSWMDAKFVKVDSSYVANPDVYLGFQVEDKNGDVFYYCRMKKEFWGNETPGANPLTFDYSNKKTNPLVGVVMSLKRGDKVRFTGRVIPISDAASGVFDIENVEMIESAADAAAVKRAKQDLEN